MNYKILMALSSFFIGTAIQALTPSETDFIFHIKQGDMKKVAQDLAQGANGNIQIGDKKETPLMIAVHELGKVIKRKIKQRKIAPVIGAIAVSSLVTTAVSVGVGMNRENVNVQNYAGFILSHDKQIFVVSALSALVSSGAAITVTSMSFYKRRINQRLAIVKAIIESPGTNVHIRNAQGQTALEILYSYVAELNGESFVQEYFKKAEASLIQQQA